MDLVLLGARLLLAAVFAVAGIGKLADLPGSRRAARAFGVPAGLADVVGTALPVVELAIAVALVPLATARWGALAALVLLLAFIAAMANQVRRGQHPDCHCFGQIHSEPVGIPTIARNAVLALIAAAVAGFGWNDPGASVIAWASTAPAFTVVTLAVAVLGLVVLAGVAWVLVQMLGQNVRLIDRLDAIEAALANHAAEPKAAAAPAPAADLPQLGLPIGTPAPAFALSGLFGETATLAALLAAGKPVLLVFSDPACVPCGTLMPYVGRWQREHADAVTIALVSRGGAEANRRKAAEHGISNVLLQKDREVAQAFLADATPSAVVVRPDGTIASWLVVGPDSVRQLAEALFAHSEAFAAAPSSPTIPLVAAPVAAAKPSAAAAPAPAAADAPARQTGEPAPAVDMRDLRGRPIRLSSFRGKPTLLLFWNLTNRLCEDMLPDVRAIDAAPPDGAPRLVVVSSGPPAGARAMRLKARIVNDPDARVTNAFGATGTPSAILLDAEGRIASPVAYGARGILALARGFDPDHAPADGAERVGRPAPNLELTGIDGAPIRLADYRGRQVLAVQWSTTCGFCQQMLDDLRAIDAAPPDGAPDLLVIAHGDEDAIRQLGLRSPVAIDTDYRGMRAFRAYGTPSAVLIDRDGTIASPIATGAAEVLALARATTPEAVADAIASIDAGHAGGAATELARGSAAPAFSLPDLDGRRVSLDDFRSHPTVVLFWNPECGFCQRLLPELLEWEQDREEDDPRLLVVSTGTAEQNRAQGFSSTVLLDRGFSVGSSFGASGTPAGILIDADGRVASAVAVGGPGVLALLEGEELDAASLSNDDPVIGLRVGANAPDLELPDLDGRPVRLSSFRGQPTMVVFWSPTCGFCQALLPRFRAWEESPPAGAPRVLIVSSGDVEENRAFGFRSPLVIDDESVAHKAFRSWSTPTAILIDADGRVASAPAEGARALLALANGEDPDAAVAAAMDADGTASLPIGSPAPVVDLPDLAGARVSTASLRGSRALVVFWNPECGYCQRMMPDLLEWEANRRPDDPRLLLISRGGAERNRDQGFTATILLDDDFAGMAAFGVSGTPSAILIDEDGKVASELAVGADEIFDLIPAPAAAIVEPAARGGRFARLFKGSGAGGA